MSRSFSVLATTALVALAMPVMTSAEAHAAAPASCQGVRATIVGKPSQTVTGTGGRDVIVSNGSGRVNAGTGHDLICVRGGGTVSVNAGPGNDQVWVEGGVSRVNAALGAGADGYHSTTRTVTDNVHASASLNDFPTPSAPNVADGDRDVIETGAGSDTVFAGRAGRLLADRIDLGSGRDSATLTARGLTQGNVVRAGAGSSLLVRGNDTGVWNIDNARRVINTGGERRFTYTGFDTFSSIGATTNITGTARAESFASSKPGTVRMGGGNDRVQLSNRTGAADLSGGPGTDVLTLTDSQPSDPITADVGDGTASVGTGSITFTLFERHELFTTGDGTLIGSDAADLLVAQACTLTIDGLAGGDRIIGANEPDFFDESDCGGAQYTVNGGAGADDITSDSPGIQVIDGGSYADTIVGSAGVSNEIIGGVGHDRITGSDGTAVGDTLRGGEGNDLVHGRAGNDQLFGDGGDDELYGDAGTDAADGGDGDDLCSAETTVNCERS